jgi:hypothetical protein
MEYLLDIVVNSIVGKTAAQHCLDGDWPINTTVTECAIVDNSYRKAE